MPITGVMPIHIPTLINVWNAIAAATPKQRSVSKGRLERSPTMTHRMMIAVRSISTITQAISAIKYGARAYRDELYDSLTPQEKAQADKYQRKQEEGQKRSQTASKPELTKAPEPKKQEFTAAPPKRKKHGMRKTLHQIGKNLDNTQEKRKALQDYNETQRKIQQEQWRMQHRDDWDMD